MSGTKEYTLSSKSGELPKYQHHPLQSPWPIRLLEIHPAGLERTGRPLKPTDHARLDYEELSWCWVKEEKNEEIHIRQGQRTYRFKVSSSLKSA